MKCTRCERFLPVKHFYLTGLLFFPSVENYFGFRTTNVKGKTDHSVSLRWNTYKHTYIHTYILYLSCRSVKKEAAKELMWTYKLKSIYKKKKKK